MPVVGGTTDIAEYSTGLKLLFGGGPTASGANVSAETAENLAAVYGCVAFLSENIAATPLELLETGTKNPATRHPLYDVLTRLPNSEMTAFDFKATMCRWMLLWGDAYARIQRDGSGRVTAIYPLRSDRMTVDRSAADRSRLRYTYTYDGNIVAQWIYDGDRPPIHHWRWDSQDGVTGRSRIRIARESLGLTKAAETFGARWFGGGSNPGGLLSTDQKLDPQRAKRMRDDWERQHQGLDQGNRIAVLEQGLKFEKITVPPNDAQFLETRKFQLEEIAGRWFRIPPHVLGHTTTSTSWGTGIESQKNGMVSFTLRAYFEAIQQWVEKDLMGSREFSQYQVRFRTNAVLRGDLPTRMSAYSTGLNARVYTVNEVRGFEDLPPVAGGDEAMPFLSTQSQQAPEPSAPADGGAGSAA